MFRMIKAIPPAIEAIIMGIIAFLHSQWNQYTPLGQFLWALALVAITVDAGIAYEYGASMSGLHAAGFALVAVAFAVLPDVASMEWSKGKKQAAGWIGVACIPLSLVAYQSHIGYGSAIRVGDIQQTGFHNANLVGKQDNAQKLNEKITFLDERTKELDAEMAALVNTKVGGWSIAVRPSSPEELDGAIEAKQLEANNEGKRKGCKRECEKRINELAHLKALRAKAKQIADNEAQHTAALEGLAKARTEVEATTYQSSTAVNQSDVFAKLVNIWSGGMNDNALNVTTVQRELTNTAIMGSASLAFLILAPILNFAAGRNRKPEFLRAWTETEHSTEHSSVWDRQAKRNEALKSAATLAKSPEPAQQPKVYTREVIRTDNGVWRDLSAALNG